MVLSTVGGAAFQPHRRKEGSRDDESKRGRKVKGTKRREIDTSNVEKKTERSAEFRRATQETHECREKRGWKSQG